LYTLDFKKKALKDLEGLPKAIQGQITARLRILRIGNQEKTLNIVPLKGSPGYYRLRSGDYRVIYYLAEDYPKELKILVIGIRHRKDAYA
jgi:mRNA-degrading endonuclease RelE of RelBE toxin-antitoxin system